MKTKKQVTNWTIKVQKNGETIVDTRTTNYRRFVSVLSLGIFPESILNNEGDVKIYIRANYGRHQDCFGDIVTFKNEGTYYSYTDATLASRAFAEVAREWEDEAQNEV